jgi:hypothetical protein
MAIHHSHHKQAEKAGYTLEERDSLVRAFHPATATEVYGVSGKDAVLQMNSFLGIYENDRDVRLAKWDEGDLLIHRRLRKTTDDTVSDQKGTPHELESMFKRGQITWTDANPPSYFTGVDPASPDGDMSVTVHAHNGEDGTVIVDKIEDTFEPDPDDKPPVDPTPLIERSENGVPLDGAVAYKEGITAADCPFSSEGDDEEEYTRFEKWNEEWDAAADEAQAEEDAEGKGGSVVSSKYRIKYAEEGHPNHCGDWLAELLNNYCIGEKNTDLAVFETICGLNGVDTSKYRREGNGWQGRIRMTGRNLLAKRVFEAKNIVVPNKDGGDPVTLDAPADWLSAQRYKAKSNG